MIVDKYTIFEVKKKIEELIHNDRPYKEMEYWLNTLDKLDNNGEYRRDSERDCTKDLQQERN